MQNVKASQGWWRRWRQTILTQLCPNLGMRDHVWLLLSSNGVIQALSEEVQSGSWEGKGSGKDHDLQITWWKRQEGKEKYNPSLEISDPRIGTKRYSNAAPIGFIKSFLPSVLPFLFLFLLVKHTQTHKHIHHLLWPRRSAMHPRPMGNQPWRKSLKTLPMPDSLTFNQKEVGKSLASCTITPSVRKDKIQVNKEISNGHLNKPFRFSFLGFLVLKLFMHGFDTKYIYPPLTAFLCVVLTGEVLRFQFEWFNVLYCKVLGPLMRQSEVSTRFNGVVYYLAGNKETFKTYPGVWCLSVHLFFSVRV